MFCSKCGKENPDNSKFCNSCGSMLQQPNAMKTTEKPPLMEAISFTEHPSREQSTIDMHQKMGWSLKSSQEINSSTTHVYGQSYNGTGQVSSYVVKEHYVKLTFERNKNMPNYDILKGKYDEFCKLSEQIMKLEASTEKFKLWLLVLPIITAAIIVLIFISNGLIYERGFFGDVRGVEWFMVVMMIFLCLFSGATVFGFEMAIVTAVRKRKIKSKINALYSQMAAIADEAEKYL